MKNGFKTTKEPRKLFSLAFAIAVFTLLVLAWFWSNLVSMGDTGRWSAEDRNEEAVLIGPYHAEGVDVVNRDGVIVGGGFDESMAQKIAAELNSGRRPRSRIGLPTTQGRPARTP
jgi:hypothetical protein